MNNSKNLSQIKLELFSYQRGGYQAEAKIAIIYGYFMVFLVVMNSQEAVLFSERDSYQDAVNSYFLCEAVGFTPGRCSRESFEQYSHPILDISRYILNMFLPTILLIYIINCKNLKAKVKEVKIIKVLGSFSSKISTTSNSTSSATPISHKS